MQNDKSLYSEVRTFLNKRGAAKQETPMSWAVNEFYSELSPVEREHLAKQQLHKIFMKGVAEFDKPYSDKPDEQMIFPGFVHLKKQYSIERDGERVLVPIESIPINTMRNRASEYRKIGAGTIEHADEIDLYCDRIEAQRLAS